MRRSLLTLLVHLLVGEVLALGHPEEEVGEEVGLMMSQVVREHLPGCHLVLTTSTKHSPIYSQIVRHLAEEIEAGVVVETAVMFSQDLVAQEELTEEYHLLQGLWGDATLSCHALILDNTNRESHSVVRFLERCGLWLRPETHVVVVGARADKEAILRHQALRNTNHAVYLALRNLSPYGDTPNKIFKSREDEASEGVEVYRRCMYCNNGEMDVQLLHRWNLTAGVPSGQQLFFERPGNFFGHQFRISTKSYFPYTNTERASEEPDITEVFMHDSLDTRMIHTMASVLNFTYDVREPLDRQWGLPAEGGNFTGIVGDVQYEQADYSLVLTVTPQRATVVTFCRVYIDESVIILSSKPRPLPEYLSLIRPFVAQLWLILLACIFVWGATLWLLQKAWSWASGGRSFTLSSAIFYSWGVILEDPPADPPNNITAQMLVGWWLVFCLVVASAYRSSLISHLVVQGKSPAINSADDLVARDGWTWGTRRMTGAWLSYMKSSPDPAIHKMYLGMQAHSFEKGMEMVMEGGYAYIYSEYYSKTMIATRYTDKLGYTPIHISTKEYPIFAGNAWAFRKGAPFLRRLDLAIQRLLEAGLITFWMDDVITTRVRNIKLQQKEERTGEDQGSDGNVIYNEDDGQVVLSLHHLQVTFYLLMLGYGLGFIGFLLENLLYALS